MKKAPLKKVKADDILINVSFFVIALIATSLGVLIKENTGKGLITIIEAGYIVAARSFGYLIGAYVCTKVYDKTNYLKISFFYYLLLFIILVFLIINSSPVSYIIAFTVFGIVKNLITVGGNQHFSSYVNQNSKSNAINIVHFIYGLGTFVSPLVLGFLMIHFGQTNTFIFLIFLVVAIGFFFLRHIASKKEEVKREETNSGAHTINIIFLIIFFALYASCELFIGTWGPYILSAKGFNDTLTYTLNSLFWLTLTFSRIFILPFSNKYQDKTITLFCIIFSLLFCVLLLTDNTIAVSISIVALGLCMGNIVPNMIKFVRAKKNVKSSETAWCFFGAGVGGIISSNIYSRMLKTNIGNAILFSLIIFALLFAVFLIFNAIKIKKESEPANT